MFTELNMHCKKEIVNVSLKFFVVPEKLFEHDYYIMGDLELLFKNLPGNKNKKKKKKT